MARTRTRKLRAPKAAPAAPPPLEQQLAVQARIAGLAHALLSLPAEELDQGIRDQLAVAAELAGVERTRIVVVHPATLRMMAAYEWSSGSAVSDLAHLDTPIWNRFPWARERIARGGEAGGDRGRGRAARGCRAGEKSPQGVGHSIGAGDPVADGRRDPGRPRPS